MYAAVTEDILITFNLKKKKKLKISAGEITVLG